MTLTVVLLTVALAAGGTATAWYATRPHEASAADAPTSTPPAPSATPTPTPTATPTADPDATFTVIAAGDVLPHTPVDQSAKTPDGWDFSPLFSAIQPWVAGADLALCHLEIPVAPAGDKPSGYPLFGAPPALINDLAEAGWDGCSTASNHSVDQGYAGLSQTLDAMDAAGLGHVGTARSAAEAAAPQLYVLDRAGQQITVAHIAATFGTNGMPVDGDKPWSVTLIDTASLIAEATAARAAGADIVIASVHCCEEYVTQPTAQQKQVDQELADSGQIDLVIGHHAHVSQPVSHLSGGPRGEGMWVAYGLGNFVSNQDEACCSALTASGLMLTATITSTGAFPAQGITAGPARVSGVEWTVITTDRRGGHQVHALADIPDGTATLTAAQVAGRWQQGREAAGTEAPERTTPPVATGPAPTVVRRQLG